MAKMVKVGTSVLKLYDSVKTQDRNINLNILASMIGSLFALLGTLVNKNQARQIIMEAMNQMGWMEEEKTEEKESK